MLISNGVQKKLKTIFLIILVSALLFFGYLFIGKPPQAERITWGVNFSQKQAELLGLDWKETYLALIDDLKVEDIKLTTYWDLIEKEEGKYNFEDLDWQIKTAESRGVKILLVIGMKTPRWPECHIPDWAKNLSKAQQQEKILQLIEKIVLKYESRTSIIRWQVENEPFFPFGECPWVDKNFLKKEIAKVRFLDLQERPIVISDSGEGSFWVQAAKLGDIVGTTMYKKVWVRQLGVYLTYPLPPTFYWRKAQIIKNLFGEEVICTELQVEPWGPKLLYDSPVEEQEKTMNLEQFKYNIEFAKRTGLKEFYLWGGEWMYWMKEVQNKPEIWNEARKLF